MHLRKYAAKTALPGIEHGYSRAPSPVWRNSTTARVRFQAMTHKEARQLYEEARRFENATRPRNCQDGALSSAGLKLLYSLLFDFLNYATGQLDPAVGTLASKAGLSRRSAFRGLAQLKAAGVLNWVRRCAAEIDEAGRLVLQQLSNAYAVLPISQWLGHRAPAVPPPPQPGTWGDHPPLPSLIEQAAAAPTLAEKLAVLETDAPNSLAAALARLGRAVDNSSRPAVFRECQPGIETLADSVTDS